MRFDSGFGVKLTRVPVEDGNYHPPDSADSNYDQHCSSCRPVSQQAHYLGPDRGVSVVKIDGRAGSDKRQIQFLIVCFGCINWSYNPNRTGAVQTVDGYHHNSGIIFRRYSPPVVVLGATRATARRRPDSHSLDGGTRCRFDSVPSPLALAQLQLP